MKETKDKAKAPSASQDQYAQTIKYSMHAKCPKCRGIIAYGGTEIRRLPTGFGFMGKRFQVDYAVYSGFRGECIACDTKVFAVRSVGHFTKYPKLGKKGAVI